MGLLRLMMFRSSLIQFGLRFHRGRREHLEKSCARNSQKKAQKKLSTHIPTSASETTPK